jgi:hypothetical protein
MSQTLYTSWQDFRMLFAQILARTTRSLCIFDDDLDKTGIGDPINMETLHTFLRNHRHANVRMVLRKTDNLVRRYPRLTQAMKGHGHLMQVCQLSDTLASVRDCLAIADKRHALVRFDFTQPRCKFLLDETSEIRPYVSRFEEIWEKSGGETVHPEATGL